MLGMGLLKIGHRTRYIGSDLYVQAGLILHQGYIPEKCRTNWAQISHLKQYISWG